MLFVRASAPEAAFAARQPPLGPEPAPTYPGLYLAGCYNRAEREVNGERVSITSLVRLPDAFGLAFRVESEADWFALDAPGTRLLHYRHCLDMAAGIAEREAVLRDRAGRETRLLETRLASMSQEGLVLLRWQLTPLNWSGALTLASRLHTAPRNGKIERSRAYEGRHLGVEPLPASEGVAVLARTTDGTRQVRLHARLRCGDTPAAPAPAADVPPDMLEQRCRVEAHAGMPFEAELRVLVDPDTSADRPDGEAFGPPFETVLDEQRGAWHALWERVPFEAPSDADLERSCRFNAFHLLQSASPLSCKRATGLPARGWQEGYFGHVFWDELFAFPFYSLRLPGIAKGLLEYRWNRLDAARQAARRAGRAGAMFPWRSAASGAEETPPWQWIPPARQWKADHTHLQQHIGSAIAFNLWNHHLATGDGELLLGHSAELLVEIARFWVSSTEPGRDGRLALRGVIGPDEYHDAYPGSERPGLDNNAYTNLMAAWTLRCAAELPERLGGADWQRLTERVGIRPQEPQCWDDASRRFELPLCEGDVIAQFEGFDRLEPMTRLPVSEDGRKEREDWWLLARGDSVNRYQITKQADVLMLFHLLGHGGVQSLVERLGLRLAEGWCRRTIEFYLARISHESSLSRIVCAGALAECDGEASWRYYRQALHTDIGPGASGSSHEGVHLGAMAGTWDVLQRFYLGLRLEPGRVAIDPHPPAALDEVSTAVWLQGRRLTLHLRGRHLHVSLEPAAAQALTLWHHGEPRRLAPGGTVALACR